MEIITMVTYAGVLIGAIIVILLIRGWVITYNKFQYWINRAQRKFADIDVVVQERLDKLQALAQMVKKYDIHEYKVMKDTIETRSKWSKDLDLNEKAKIASEVENSFMKLQAVFERYPDLKADALHQSLISKGSRVESRLRKTRLAYNRVAQKYNKRVKTFPRNIVALIHGFKPLSLLAFENQESYKPKKIFED